MAFATAAGFIPQVEQAGFEAFPAGLEVGEWLDDLKKVWSSLQEGSTHDEIMAAWGEHTFGGSVAMRFVDDLPNVLRTWPADLIVHEDTALGAAVAAEQLGIPHARVMILAAGPDQPCYSHIDRAVAKLRAAAGLGLASTDDSLQPQLLLYPFPPSFLRPNSQVPKVLHAIRPALPNLAPDDELPGWLVERDRQRPLVYGTLGTLANRPDNDGIFVAILAALSSKPVDGVVTIGRNRDPATFGTQSPNVRVERFIPSAALMPLCDAVVSHGGSGTVVAALACGLPQVLLPLSADQFENAQRVAALGAGIIADDAHSSEAIGAALDTVLSEPGFRQSARRMKEEIESLPGLEHAVVLLERIAAGDTLERVAKSS